MDLARFRVMRRALIALALIGSVAAGCTERSNPSTASSTNLTGTWIGDITAAQQSARMTWTLTQSDANVTGPARLGLSSGVVLLNGFLVGTLSGSTLTYTITVAQGGIPLQPNCTGQIGGSMTASLGTTSTLSGTSAVTGSNCTPPFPGGTITLTRQ